MQGAFHYISDSSGVLFKDQSVQETQHRQIRFSQPPALPDLWELVGGQVERIPGFTRYTTARGAVPCVAYRRRSAGPGSRPAHPNHLATLLWQLGDVSPAPGATPETLQGPIVIVTGDTEFLAELEHQPA